jgi:CBS domain-containing protein
VPEIVPLTTAPVKHLSLSSTARSLARPSLSVEPADSLALAASRLIQNGYNFLPVIAHEKLVGVITGRGLANALGEAVEPSDAVSDYMSQTSPIRGYATGAEALRTFVEGEPLVVVDDDERLIGILSPADLFPRYRPQLRPPLVGGLATPFGVYLTSGNLGAGVPVYALISSGAAITAMFSAATVLGGLLSLWLHRNGLQSGVTDSIQIGSTVLLFCAIFKLVPLSGIHGAEHQVVHAIERELELTPSVVKRMPLVHPRCGTNYSVAFSLFLGIFGWEWTPQPEYRLLVAVIATLALWRPLGRFAQLFVTTKRPNAKQLDQAISAGHELLGKYASAKSSYPNIGQRIWNSGLPYILIGCCLVSAICAGIGYAFHLTVF